MSKMSRKSVSPRLRTANKVKPPYPLNQFPKDFGYKLGEELIYLLATKGTPSLEGQEWEEIFARCIGADWKPSNVGLDDVVLASCAWGAKTVKSSAKSLTNLKKVRLISGRNSPVYSFGESEIAGPGVDPNVLGREILEIWNERVSSVREKFKHVRTIVLVKSKDLLEVAVFEFETIRYDPELYTWTWNKNKNLEGRRKSDGFHCFTWQPHGSQFTIIEPVPQDVLFVSVKKPPKLKRDTVLNDIGFDKTWVTVKHRK